MAKTCLIRADDRCIQAPLATIQTRHTALDRRKGRDLSQTARPIGQGRAERTGGRNDATGCLSSARAGAGIRKIVAGCSDRSGATQRFGWGTLAAKTGPSAARETRLAPRLHCGRCRVTVRSAKGYALGPERVTTRARKATLCARRVTLRRARSRFCTLRLHFRAFLPWTVFQVFQPVGKRRPQSRPQTASSGRMPNATKRCRFRSQSAGWVLILDGTEGTN